MGEKTRSPLEYIRKRDDSLQKFNEEKISAAVFKAMSATGTGSKKDANNVAKAVIKKALATAKSNLKKHKDGEIAMHKDVFVTVEMVQDMVEQELMAESFLTVAKAYILYRANRSKLRERNLFKKRINLKPYEYPELYEYTSAIRHSYWLHTEFNYVSDIQDFKVNVNDVERSAIKNSMLAIAQVEVAVKTFWGNIYSKMPKPELAAVGFTFAESEVRHMDAYSHLLEILNLNEEFGKINDIPALKERVEYLNSAILTSKSEDNREYAKSILLFSLFIEHVSLFSQFLIMMSFNKHKNLFKGISNAVEATSKEEEIHGLFGIEVIKLIRDENPEWFDDEYNQLILDSCKQAYESEMKVLDWILEAGELDFLPKKTVQEFLKNRFNNSMRNIGLKPIFEVNQKLVDETEWFNDEITATKHGDFFVKRSINYNKRSQSITGDDLF